MSQDRQQGNNNQRKKTLLDDYRQPHPATKEPLQGGKYPAQGMFQQKKNGTIVFKINDGVYVQGGQGSVNPKEVELNYADRTAIFNAVREAATDPNFGTAQIVIAKRQYVFSGGQSKLSENPITQATFTVVRTDKGVVGLGYSKGDYKAQLIFKGANFTTVYVKNEAGDRVEDSGMISRWVARGWVTFHEDLLNRMEMAGWEPPKPRDNDSNGDRNRGNNNNSNAGYGNDSVDDMDEFM